MMGFRRDAACCAAHERATTKRSDRLYSELGTHDTEFLRVRIVALPKADKHTRRIRRYSAHYAQPRRSHERQARISA